MNRVYVQTNDADRNEVIAFERSDAGRLAQLGRYETGGRGTGKPHLASQSSVVLTGDGAWLLVANAGSDEVSLFAVEPNGLRLAGRVASGGSDPTSVAVHGDLVYVLNNGTPSVNGFRLDGGALAPVEGSERALSAEADPAQIAFNPDGSTLVVTERGTPRYRLTRYASVDRQTRVPPKNYLRRLRRHQPRPLTAAEANALHDANRGER